MRRGLIIGTIGVSLAGSASGADWTFTPSLGLQEQFTDNAFGTQNKRADVITQLSPGIDIRTQGPKLTLDFGYNPTLSAYAATPSQDRIDQNLLGEGDLTIFTDLLDVQFNATASENSGSGNYTTPASTGLVPLNDRVLNYAGSIAPHFHERFGDLATLDFTYRVSSSNTSPEGASQGRNGLSNSLLQQSPQLVIGSGDSFGQLTSQLSLAHTDGTGSGLNNEFATDSDAVNWQYHLTHEYAVTGSFGYQRTHYDRTATSQGYDNKGATWNLGIRVTPNDVSELALSYGKQQGGYAVNANLVYDLAPRTLLTGSYVVQVENNLQAVANSLQFLQTNAAGIQIDTRTGLPFNAASPGFGQQNTLFRDTLAQIAMNHSFERSSMSFTVQWEKRQPLDGATSDEQSWGPSISYSQELTPVVSGNVDFGYHTSIQSGSGFGGTSVGNTASKSINADASMTYTINETLSGNLVYSYFHRISPTQNYGVVINTLTVGLRKSF